MDIHSLLSPSDGGRPNSETSTPAAHAPREFTRRTPSGPPKPVAVASPLSQSLASSSLPSHVLSPFQGVKGVTSPLNSPLPATGMQPSLSRNTSSRSMDTLAELASMQSPQPPRSTPPVLRSRESYESQLSPSTIFPNVAPVSVTSNPRPSYEVAMMETSRSAVRIDFSSTSLPLEVQQRASLLAKTLQEHPSAFVSHTELINLLHHGFVNHVYPPSSPNAHGDPHSYDLLQDLRAARENMHKLFAMGEDLWMDCLRDESMLARTNDDRIAVTNKCLDAIAEEYGSIKLWKMYGDWMLHCHNLAQGVSTPNGANETSSDDLMLAQGTFTWDLVLETWRQAVENTRFRISDSQIIWDQYIGLMMRASHSSGEHDHSIKILFEERLCIAHATWDDTFQAFSNFISNSSFKESYENTMVDTTRMAADAKAQWSHRESLEANLQAAQTSGDSDAEYLAFGAYIRWEQTPEKRRRPDFDLTNAIFQRAELRYPSDASLWEDHVMWLIERCPNDQKGKVVLSTLERATRHCPWSGSLWSQYLLTSEKERHPYPETENIKHKATSTGLLDVGGIEEVLQVHASWCSYLRRRAFRENASDEDLDVAEMGIRSSIENVQELAMKLGHGARPDSRFRLERIHIKLLTDSDSWDSAKEAFRGIASRFGDSSEFWLSYYNWEMMRWRKFVLDTQQKTDNQLGKVPSPHFATAVLREALQQLNLDRPGRINERLIAHCEDYESVDELQKAIVEVKHAEKAQKARKEEEEATLLQAADVDNTNGWGVAPAADASSSTGKRKREDVTEIDRENKRARNEEVHVQSIEEQPPQRDREHATVIVQHLPNNVTDTRIRQFFRDCGTVNTVRMLRGTDRIALVEFEDHASAEFALSRSGKDLGGSAVAVSLQKNTTLYVTNYPPAIGEAELRSMFEEYGPVVDIRLPSLKGNAGRRFCYVQFKEAKDAQNALALDEVEMEPNLKLSVAISDPSKKQERSGVAEEGRQVFVRELAFKVTEKDLEKEFSDYGTVEAVKIPKDDKDRSKGYGFVTFASHGEAEAALEMEGRELKGRSIRVSIARKPGSKHQAVREARSHSHIDNGDGGSPSATSATSVDEKDKGSRQQRTIAIVNVPDTVNVDRVQSLAQQHGAIAKVSIQPLHQGAILEYAEASSAGKAALGFEGFEIVPGRPLRVVTVQEMFKENAETKIDKIQVGKKAKVAFQPDRIKRPVQAASRRGGHLGQKVGLGLPKHDVNGEVVNGNQSSKKSNDDFRAML